MRKENNKKIKFLAASFTTILLLLQCGNFSLHHKSMYHNDVVMFSYQQAPDLKPREAKIKRKIR